MPLRDEPGIGIDGGQGVARVTKGGLGIPIGEAAITRVPRR
jgi:cobalt-precorrin-5B (C1)-methyltransferase